MNSWQKSFDLRRKCHIEIQRCHKNVLMSTKSEHIGLILRYALLLKCIHGCTPARPSEEKPPQQQLPSKYSSLGLDLLVGA